MSNIKLSSFWWNWKNGSPTEIKDINGNSLSVYDSSGDIPTALYAETNDLALQLYAKFENGQLTDEQLEDIQFKFILDNLLIGNEYTTNTYRISRLKYDTTYYYSKYSITSIIVSNIAYYEYSGEDIVKMNTHRTLDVPSGSSNFKSRAVVLTAKTPGGTLGTYTLDVNPEYPLSDVSLKEFKIYDNYTVVSGYIVYSIEVNNNTSESFKIDLDDTLEHEYSNDLICTVTFNSGSSPYLSENQFIILNSNSLSYVPNANFYIASVTLSDYNYVFPKIRDLNPTLYVINKSSVTSGSYYKYLDVFNKYYGNKTTIKWLSSTYNGIPFSDISEQYSDTITIGNINNEILSSNMAFSSVYYANSGDLCERRIISKSKTIQELRFCRPGEIYLISNPNIDVEFYTSVSRSITSKYFTKFKSSIETGTYNAKKCIGTCIKYLVVPTNAYIMKLTYKLNGTALNKYIFKYEYLNNKTNYLLCATELNNAAQTNYLFANSVFVAVNNSYFDDNWATWSESYATQYKPPIKSNMSLRQYSQTYLSYDGSVNNKTYSYSIDDGTDYAMFLTEYKNSIYPVAISTQIPITSKISNNAYRFVSKLEQNTKYPIEDIEISNKQDKFDFINYYPIDPDYTDRDKYLLSNTYSSNLPTYKLYRDDFANLNLVWSKGYFLPTIEKDYYITDFIEINYDNILFTYLDLNNMPISYNDEKVLFMIEYTSDKSISTITIFSDITADVNKVIATDTKYNLSSATKYIRFMYTVDYDETVNLNDNIRVQQITNFSSIDLSITESSFDKEKYSEDTCYVDTLDLSSLISDTSNYYISYKINKTYIDNQIFEIETDENKTKNFNISSKYKYLNEVFDENNKLVCYNDGLQIIEYFKNYIANYGIDTDIVFDDYHFGNLTNSYYSCPYCINTFKFNRVNNIYSTDYIPIVLVNSDTSYIKLGDYPYSVLKYNVDVGIITDFNLIAYDNNSYIIDTITDLTKDTFYYSDFDNPDNKVISKIKIEFKSTRLDFDLSMSLHFNFDSFIQYQTILLRYFENLLKMKLFVNRIINKYSDRNLLQSDSTFIVSTSNLTLDLINNKNYITTYDNIQATDSNTQIAIFKVKNENYITYEIPISEALTMPSITVYGDDTELTSDYLVAFLKVKFTEPDTHSSYFTNYCSKSNVGEAKYLIISVNKGLLDTYDELTIYIGTNHSFNLNTSNYFSIVKSNNTAYDYNLERYITKYKDLTTTNFKIMSDPIFYKNTSYLICDYFNDRSKHFHDTITTVNPTENMNLIALVNNGYGNINDERRKDDIKEIETKIYQYVTLFMCINPLDTLKLKLIGNIPELEEGQQLILILTIHYYDYNGEEKSYTTQDFTFTPNDYELVFNDTTFSSQDIKIKDIYKIEYNLSSGGYGEFKTTPIDLRISYNQNKYYRDLYDDILAISVNDLD